MFRKILVLALVASAAPVAALAANSSGGTALNAWGPRVGFSTGPDQFLIGGQLDFSDVAPNIGFVPNLDIGFGDHVTTFDLNADLHYMFTLRDSPWRPYVGAGVGITFSNFSSDVGGDSETDVGGSLIVGATAPTKRGSRFFSEAKLGLGDIADFKLLVGWNFPM